MITVKKPSGYLFKEVKERIIFLLCLANYGGMIKVRINDERVWKNFRKGHFAFSRYEYFHVNFLNGVTWLLIFSFYMTRPKRIIIPRSPSLCYWRNDYGMIRGLNAYSSDDGDDKIMDLNAYATNDEDMGAYLEYNDDELRAYFEYIGAYYPISVFDLDIFMWNHYEDDDEMEDSIKEINQELWDRKKRRQDHTPKRRWKQKIRRRKRDAPQKIEI